VDPDIVVEQDPVKVLEGHDPQLERGVQELMKLLPATPAGLPAACGPTRQNRDALRMSELATLGLARATDARENCGDVAQPDRTGADLVLDAGARAAFHFRTRILGGGRATRTANCGVRHHAFRDEVAHLNLLAVAPEHRRQGLGRQLMDWLTATAIEAGVFASTSSCVPAMSPRRVSRMWLRPAGVVQVTTKARHAALRMSRRLAKNQC